MERLNPLNDYIFKRIMGEEESKENLISFLNAILDVDDQKKLVSLEIIDNKELTKEMIADKSGRLDVRAKTADGMQLNIEVQLTNQHNMEKRTMFYWGKLFLEGIKQGDDYINLTKVITINILDFNFLDLEKFHSKKRITGRIAPNLASQHNHGIGFFQFRSIGFVYYPIGHEHLFPLFPHSLRSVKLLQSFG